MSLEQAILARAQPQVAANRITNLIQHEICKGCEEEISPQPLRLEPPYTPIYGINNLCDNTKKAFCIPISPPTADELVRLQIWLSPDKSFNWIRSELFLKQLQNLTHRAGFEIIGNEKSISLSLLCHRFDLPVIRAAFHGEFETCELTVDSKNILSSLPMEVWESAVFRDYYPPPPYSHILTCPGELTYSHLISLIFAIMEIKDNTFGLYQCLFQRVSEEHNWHGNVEALLDFEFMLKLKQGLFTNHRFAQQIPSGDLRNMAVDMESKAHNDKPFFTAALRVAVIGKQSDEMNDATLRTISTFTGVLQHGGRPLQFINHDQYRQFLSGPEIKKMFNRGLTYRPGFLVNSQELTSLVHLPDPPEDDYRRTLVDTLAMSPPHNPELTQGTLIGKCQYADTVYKIHIPDEIRARHLHSIGSSGVGKSALQKEIVLSDIAAGHGVAVLDPHGDLIDDILNFIPGKDVERTIYLNPGDPGWVPIWNPIKWVPVPGQDIGRCADDIVMAIQSFVASSGWGDRLENILRHLVYGIMHLPNGTFFDISTMLNNKSRESSTIRAEIMKIIDNETAKQFWVNDYINYRKEDFGPPRNKLGKLLVSGTVALMLSQPESRFNFREVMDNGMILLVDLSQMGALARSILGCFILSLLHLTALSRRSTPIKERKQFHIHCDEAHKFITEALEEIIVETRKYGVSLSLAHQYLSQFGKQKTDAISGVGTTIIFNVDNRDAHYLCKDLRGQVNVDDIISLKRGEAIARIGTDIMKIKTIPPMPPPSASNRQAIINRSRELYCRPTHEVRKWLRNRHDRWQTPLISLNKSANNDFPEEFIYEEF